MAKTVSKKKAAGSAKAKTASEGKAVGAKKVAKKKATGKASSSTQKVVKSPVASKPTAKKKATSKATATVKKTAAKKVSTKKTAAKKAPEAKEDAVAKKVTAKKVAAKKVDAVAEEPAAKSATAKKTTTKKTATKKTVAKKATSKKVSTKASAEPETETDAEAVVEKKAKKKASAKSTPSIAVGEQVTATVVPYEREKNNHYMDKEQLAHFSQKLAEWKQQLMEEVDRTVGHMKDDATNFPDPNDRATQEEEFSLELRTRDRERKLIKKINEAQKRIEELEYGYCETCGVEIGVGRLEARPTAELCIDCKTLEEIREKQIA